MTMPPPRAALVLLGLLLARPLSAQIDYRNLDDDRPVATEDAYPVERHAFELILPYHFEAEADGGSAHAVVPELAYGVLANTQIGFKLPFASLSHGGDGETGLSGLRLFTLYNFNTESAWLPALALRGDLSLPVGPLAGDATRFTVKAIATRSWGATRAHVNAAWALGSDAPLAAAEPAPRWSASIAVDRTMIRRSLLFIGELGASEARHGSPTEVNAAAGVRWQWTPTVVLDAGLQRRLRKGIGPDVQLTLGLSHAFGIRRLTPMGGDRAGGAPAGRARVPQRDEQFYYPGDFNWKFLASYPEAARLFNAFDYGHAVLYERLYTTHGARTARALDEEYRYLTTDLLIRPPRFAIVEEAVMPNYAKLAWRGKQMFDWAHILHRQIYDIYADPALTRPAQDSLIERVTDHYLARTDYAFLPVPKSMALMDDQYYSQSFRQAHPKFNGLIWAYHWLQVGLYEPFIEGRTPDERKAGVQATLARFWSMLEDAPERLPSVMPMTSAVAPKFSDAHPRAAVIFDNLHMMHDIISDILQNDAVPPARKGHAIDLALDEFQNPTRNVISMEMWRNMADHMGGVAAMGGPATGIVEPIVAPPAAGDSSSAPPADGHHGHDTPP